jgi:translation initiation factor eIF-2B subunit alpha
MQKPFYALAESYKFLRHFPLSQTDLPIPRLASSGSSDPPLSFLSTMPPQSGKAGALTGPGAVQDLFNQPAPSPGGMEMTKEMEDLNPMVDVTTPDLIDFIMTDLGAPLSPTSVSQYLVAQFSS